MNGNENASADVEQQGSIQEQAVPGTPRMRLISLFNPQKGFIIGFTDRSTLTNDVSSIDFEMRNNYQNISVAIAELEEVLRHARQTELEVVRQASFQQGVQAAQEAAAQQAAESKDKSSEEAGTSESKTDAGSAEAGGAQEGQTAAQVGGGESEAKTDDAPGETGSAI